MKTFKELMAERCWPGYKPAPGKKAYAKGSCVKEEVELDEEIHSPGTKVRVPHKGKMVSGKVVRHDKGSGGYSPAYVVDVGEYESKIVPSHKVQKEEVEQIDEISADLAGKYLTAPQGKGANKYKVGPGKSRYPNAETMFKHTASVKRALQRSDTSSLNKKPSYYKEEVEELDEAKKMEYDQKKVNHLKYIVGILEKEKKEFSRLKGSKEVMDIIDKSINLFAKEYTKHLNALSAGRGQDTNFSVHEEVEELDEKMISVRNAIGKTLKVASQFKEIYKKHGYKPVPGTRSEEYEEDDGPLTEDQLKQIEEVAAWQRKEGKSEAGGLNRKGIESYRRENPGSKLSMAVTTKPSKLKPGSKAANRRKSFCARMGGMKRRLTSAKTARDPDSRINKALRKWNC